MSCSLPTTTATLLRTRPSRVQPTIVFLAVIGVQIGRLASVIAGVIFAVPDLAVLRVFFDFFRARLRTSPNGNPGRPGRF